MTQTNDAFAWTGHGAGSTPSVANGLNQITSIAGVASVHDGRGNLTGDPATSRSYGYDGDNQLISASGGGLGSATLSYDPLGRLYQLAAAATRRFVYDGLDLIAEYDTGDAVIKRTVHGPRVDEPLVEYAGAGTASRRWVRFAPSKLMAPTKLY